MCIGILAFFGALAGLVGSFVGLFYSAGSLTSLGWAATGATVGAAAGGAFSKKPPMPRFPKITKPKTPSVKIKGESERARAYIESRRKRGSSREKSQVTMPGFLAPAQIQRHTLSDVLG